MFHSTRLVAGYYSHPLWWPNSQYHMCIASELPPTICGWHGPSSEVVIVLPLVSNNISYRSMSNIFEDV